MKYRQRLAAETHSASYEQARRLPLVTEADISIIDQHAPRSRSAEVDVAVALPGGRRAK